MDGNVVAVANIAAANDDDDYNNNKNNNNDDDDDDADDDVIIMTMIIIIILKLIINITKMIIHTLFLDMVTPLVPLRNVDNVQNKFVNYNFPYAK